MIVVFPSANHHTRIALYITLPAGSYYRNGKSCFESKHSKNKEVAKDLVRKREGKISEGTLPGICFDKMASGEVAEIF